jgi:hypothetical protein
MYAVYWEMHGLGLCKRFKSPTLSLLGYLNRQRRTNEYVEFHFMECTPMLFGLLKSVSCVCYPLRGSHSNLKIESHNRIYIIHNADVNSQSSSNNHTCVSRF